MSVELLEEKENEQNVDGTRYLSRLVCLGRKFVSVLSKEDQIMREDLIKREREWSTPPSRQLSVLYDTKGRL